MTFTDVHFYVKYTILYITIICFFFISILYNTLQPTTDVKFLPFEPKS